MPLTFQLSTKYSFFKVLSQIWSVSNPLNGSSLICCCLGLCWLTHVNKGSWCYLSLFPFHTLLKPGFTINWKQRRLFRNESSLAGLVETWGDPAPLLAASRIQHLGYHTTTPKQCWKRKSNPSRCTFLSTGEGRIPLSSWQENCICSCAEFKRAKYQWRQNEEMLLLHPNYPKTGSKNSPAMFKCLQLAAGGICLSVESEL